ncbi:hypothetical protein Tco_1130969 [Tanacetum coccineum]
MEELCQLSLNGRGRPIAPIAIQATKFGLKNDMIQQVQNSCQFRGPGDDANKHLDKFLHVTQSMKVNGVSDDAIRLYLLPYSLQKRLGLGEVLKIRASTDTAIRNQEASIKTLEIQIKEMSKVLQERGFGGLPSSTETNPRDHVKSISIICEEKKGSYGPQFSEAYSKASHIDESIPQKEKDPGSFTLPYFINNVCFDNALVDLGASVSIMPLLTYLNLRLGELAHTRLTVELVDRTVKYPKRIAENVLV